MRSVIAERMKVSDDYVRRVLKRLRVLENGPSNPATMRPIPDITVQAGVSSTGERDEWKERLDA